MADIGRRVAWVAGIFAAIATVLGMLGGVWWGLDLLANFRLQYLVILAAAAIMVRTQEQRLAAYIFGIVALFNAALIAPLYIGEARAPADDARLEIVSSNLQRHRSRDHVRWLVDQEADLIFLFESSRLTEDLLRTLDLGYVVTSAIVPEEGSGLSIMSRAPVAVEVLDTARDGGEAIRMETRLGNETVALYAIHPPSPSNPFRAQTRDRFLTRIGDLAAAETMPVIVVGDFNSTPWSVGFRNVAGPGDLVNSQNGYGYGATWPAHVWPIFGVPLDHLLHSADLTVVEREVGPASGPDHRPIRVVLANASTGESS